MSFRLNELLVCPHCDALHRSVVLKRYEIATCVVCGRVLARHHSLSIDQLLALTVAAAMLFVIANGYPLMTIEVGGMHTQATVWTCVLLMLHGWTAWPAGVLAVTMFALPLLQIVLLLWVLTFAQLGRRAPGIRAALIALHLSRPWSMSEVFLLGTLVTIVKLSGWVSVAPGIGTLGLVSLTILLTILSKVEVQSWWSLLEVSRR